MTPQAAKKRIAQIEALQNGFTERIAKLDTNLLLALLEAAEGILASPRELGKLLTKFEQQAYLPALQNFGVDLVTIKSLNSDYFATLIGEEIGGKVVSEALFTAVTKKANAVFAEAFGISADGQLLAGGQLDLFAKDTAVRRELQSFLYSQRSANVGLTRFKKNLRQLVKPGEGKGVYSKHMNTTVYDAYQQADRSAQQTFSEGIGLRCFLYTGGTVTGTRPFCRLRDGKVFTRTEIDKWGTSADPLGGYDNKTTGHFAGKPATYTPFLSAGGYACRHHFSALSDRQAIRERPEIADLL